MYSKTGRLLIVLGVSSRATNQPELQLWSVDALVKVFPDDKPAPAAPAPVEVARGEHRIVPGGRVFSIGDPKPAGDDGRTKTSRRSGIRARAAVAAFRWVCPVDRPTQKPSQDQLRKPPADYPDPLAGVAHARCTGREGTSCLGDCACADKRSAGTYQGPSPSLGWSAEIRCASNASWR